MTAGHRMASSLLAFLSVHRPLEPSVWGSGVSDVGREGVGVVAGPVRVVVPSSATYSVSVSLFTPTPSWCRATNVPGRRRLHRVGNQRDLPKRRVEWRAVRRHYRD